MKAKAIDIWYDLYKILVNRDDIEIPRRTLVSRFVSKEKAIKFLNEMDDPCKDVEYVIEEVYHVVSHF